MNKTKSTWYVLYVRSKQENKVHQVLCEHGLESFLPLVKTIRKWSDRKKVLYQPLFPSYIFVNLKSKNEFNRALSIKGACSYIKFGSEYAKVSNDEIRKIKILNNANDLDHIETDGTRFLKGDYHKITYGALNGLECEILNGDNNNKIVVRIDSIRQNIIATLPKVFLSKQNLKKIA
ncbi:UpxY family transcription antiterminator [Aquimarina sp. D1M17]|uniref:UpxY family transcription antiterminator n=1 Tax=Aquimarina acroporae TaxID=2937283 RepID=UPI0020BF28CE|nr:UpxY family transcription antiterminator [Aquimarina acroporae]MCK8522372.1 UpxY family transcription antiterminator [Aquimarina acroporae]